MPESGGRLGTKLPAPAATTTTCAINFVPASVVSFQRPSASFSSAVAISLKWNCGSNGLTCSRSRLVSSWPVTMGKPRNVVDGLFRIKLGALAARPVEDVDQMAFEIEQAQLEHREQADGPRADNGYICLNRRAQGYSHLNAWNGWGKRGPYM